MLHICKYIYIYIYIYIHILKPFNNVLDQKKVFKKHLFSTNISHSLQKLRQYNKKLRNIKQKSTQHLIQTN